MSRVDSFFQGMTQPRDQYSDSAEGSHWFIKNCPGNTLQTVVQILLYPPRRVDVSGERMKSEVLHQMAPLPNSQAPHFFPSLSSARSCASPGDTKRNQTGFVLSSQPEYLQTGPVRPGLPGEQAADLWR